MAPLPDSCETTGRTRPADPLHGIRQRLLPYWRTVGSSDRFSGSIVSAAHHHRPLH